MRHSAGRAPFRAALHLFRMERIHMPKGLKAALIFAAMIALPILADNLLNRRPDVRLFHSFEWSGVLLVLFMILLAVSVAGWFNFWKFKEDIEGIQGNLKLAERELTKILADNWDQKGRIGKVRERAEWAAMANPAIFPTIFHILKSDDAKDDKLIALAQEPPKWSQLAQPLMPQPSMAQPQAPAYPEAFGKLAEQAFEMAKTDMSNRGTAMGKATMTAILLREMYQGSTGRAVKKITHEFDAGGTPFIAPGLRQLLDFNKFNMATKKFPDDHKPVDWMMLSLAVEHGKFPKELRLVDSGKLFEGWMVIKKLTEPAPPAGEDWTAIPDTPPDISMTRLWWKWLTWWE
jgi:hypothetical protein